MNVGKTASESGMSRWGRTSGRRSAGWWGVAAAALLFSLAPALRAEWPLPQPEPGHSIPVVDLDKVLKELPTGDRWVKHVREDLLPYWTLEDALGEPVGNFPTYRTNAGKVFDPSVRPLPPEFQNPASGIVWLDRDHVRSKGRQTFLYGVAYHMTGEENYLRYAKAGADWLIAHAIDKTNGGAYSWFTVPGGKGQPSVHQRTSQDLAYCLTGLAFFYYLTHDEAYLEHVIAIKNHIWKEYFDEETGMLRWVSEPNADGDSPKQKELVSQLDQVYGYLLWTTMALPAGELRTHWEKDLVHLATMMRNQFFSDRLGMYWGGWTKTSDKNLGTAHTDFGHSIKTLWLTYRVGLLTGDQALVEFAKPRITNLLKLAYDSKTGSWVRGFKKNSSGQEWVIDDDKEWWSLAELDQTTGTIALVDPAYAEILVKTFKYWFDHMVDKDNHEIWHMVHSDGTVDPQFPKIHSWKNGFHSHEHALVCYLVSEQLHDRPIKLYYAFKEWPPSGTVHPYLYWGKIAKSPKASEGNPFKAPKLKDYRNWVVWFTDLR